MALSDPRQLAFLMDIDQALRELAEQHPQNEQVRALKGRFYTLAGDQFDRSVLGEIHEHVLERSIQQQAQGFYQEVPAPIKDELIDAYRSMEHHRRRNQFGLFCEQIFKQIECLVNYVFADGALLRHIIDIRLQPAYSWDQVFYNQSQGVFQQRTGKTVRYGYPVQSMVLSFRKNGVGFYKESEYADEFKPGFTLTSSYISKLDFGVKYRIVLYCLYFREKVEDFQFDEMKKQFDQIKAVRNLIHGGGISQLNTKPKDTLTPSERTAQAAMANKEGNLLLFQGFLARFITTVIANFNQQALKANRQL